MPRGVGNIPAGGSGGGPGRFINRVRLLDKFEAEQGRFLTEEPDIYWERCHRYQETSPKGKQFWVVQACPQTIGQPCIRCNQGDGASTFWFAWFYTDFTDFSKPGENRVETKVGTIVRYRQKVGEVRLVCFSTAHKDMLTEFLLENESLTGVDSRILRRTEAGSQRPSYSLKAVGEGTERPDLDELKDKLPDLEDVAYRKVQKLNLGDEPATVAVGAGAPPEVVGAGGLPASDGEDPGPNEQQGEGVYGSDDF
jgi:hypothetical protein